MPGIDLRKTGGGAKPWEQPIGNVFGQIRFEVPVRRAGEVEVMARYSGMKVRRGP